VDDPITTFLAKVQAQGVPVPAKARESVLKAIAAHGDQFSADTVQQFTDKFLDGLKSIIKPADVVRAIDDEGGTKLVTEGATPTTLQSDLTRLISQYDEPHALVESMNLPFKIDVATDVMRGGARFVSQNYDQAELDEWPALELLRVYERDVPRGFKRGPKGTLIEVPDDDWPSRWEDACNAAGDEDALRVLKDTGRMIALKSSGVWEELGKNRDDTLGNPYPPFAFNSGYDVDGVDRAECLQLGLMQEGDVAERADVDWENLFSLAE